MNDIPVSSEVILAPAQSLARVENQAVAPLFGTSDPVAVIEKAAIVASALREVIRKQGLISKISGKEYPRCEAWTLLGTMIGVYPVLEWCRPLENGNGFEARVQARMRDGSVVGAAEAECTREEKNWANRDSFALRSMAQTRATAKALRMPLGFVMTLSGFEATPAEEMAFEREEAPKTPHNRSQAPPPPSSHPQTATRQPASTPVTATPKVATDSTRAWMIEALSKDPGCETTQEWFSQAGILLPTEKLEDVPLRYVPTSKHQLSEMITAISKWKADGIAVFPWHPDPEPAKSAVSKPIEVPREQTNQPEPEGAWRAFPMPFGKNAGTPLGELDKKYLYGLWANYEVETEYNGKPKKPETIARDEAFREHLDAAGEHYDFTV